MANAIGASAAITAGAVISGAYFGDKMTPLSETTILTPQIVGSNVYAHIRSMSKATIPAYLISLVMFFLIGQVNEITPPPMDTTATLEALRASTTSACGTCCRCWCCCCSVSAGIRPSCPS